MPWTQTGEHRSPGPGPFPMPAAQLAWPSGEPPSARASGAKLDSLEVRVTKSCKHFALSLLQTHPPAELRERGERRGHRGGGLDGVGQTLLCLCTLSVCSVTQPPRPPPWPWPQASSVSGRISWGPQLTTHSRPLVTVPVFRQQGRGHQSWPRTQPSHPPWGQEVGAG